MQMTRIQRDALARARRGDFELADAIELEARINGSPWDGDIVGGYRTHRLTALAEGELDDVGCDNCARQGDYTCSDCEGTELIDCTECKTTGEVVGPLGAMLECPKCAGTLEIECETCFDGKVVCGQCEGAGTVPGDPEIYRIVDLNGCELWEDETGSDAPPDLGRWVGVEWAQGVIRKYHEQAAAEGAATTTEEAA